MTRIRFNPEISWGTVFTLLGGVGVAISLWFSIELNVAKAHAAAGGNADKIMALEQRVSRLEERLDGRLNTIDGKIDRLLERSAR